MTDLTETSYSDNVKRKNRLLFPFKPQGESCCPHVHLCVQSCVVVFLFFLKKFYTFACQGIMKTYLFLIAYYAVNLNNNTVWHVIQWKMHFINGSSANVSTSIKAEVLVVCCSGASRSLNTIESRKETSLEKLLLQFIKVHHSAVRRIGHMCKRVDIPANWP